MHNIYQIFIIMAFLFFFGAVLGWILELVFRRFSKKANPEGRWLNPGFLTGPCLPIYGLGSIALYILSITEKYFINAQKTGVLYYIIMFFIMALAMTLIEYIAGIIFVKGMHIKLWDYSDEPGNIQGVVCPKFTLIWGVLAALYYFFLFPSFDKLVLWFVDHPWFSFVVGTVFGFFIIDCAFSFHLGSVLHKKAAEIDKKATVDFQFMQRRLQQLKVSKFFTPHDDRYLTSKIQKFEEFIHRTPASVEESLKNK